MLHSFQRAFCGRISIRGTAPGTIRKTKKPWTIASPYGTSAGIRRELRQNPRSSTRDMGVCPDQPAGFRDWVLSISEVRYPRFRCKRGQWRSRSCYRLLQQDSTEPDSAVLCEVKGIRSALDADQKRKGNTDPRCANVSTI